MDDLRPGPALTITIATATATARTELAAFDRAIVGVGAENRNLIRLSSVRPLSTARPASLTG